MAIIIRDTTTKVTQLILVREGLEVPGTNGTDTIANSKEVFSGSISADFKNWGINIPSKPTTPAKALVCKVGNGTYEMIFDLPGHDLDFLAWEQSQVVAFCRKHYGWLQGERGLVPIFLFRVEDKGRKEFFVCRILFSGNNKNLCLCPHVNHFNHEYYWSSYYGLHVVLPQLTLKS